MGYETHGTGPGEAVWSTRDTLRRSEELFRALTLHSGDIISLLDADGRLLYNSPATERINGFTAADLEGIDTFELIHPDDRATVQEVFAKVLASPGAVEMVRYRYRTKDGRWLWMEAIASNQLDNPAVRGVVANSRDISARVAAEEAQRHLEAQMLNVQKLESLGVLAGGVAHDFNNLLTVMLGQASLLRTAMVPDAVREAALQIEGAARQAAELTQLLLAYAGKSHFEPRPTSLAALVESSRALLELSVAKHGSLVLELDADAPAVQADPRQLRQLVLNLVQNGAEALVGGGEVRIAVQCLRASAAELSRSIVPTTLVPDQLAVRLRCADTGVGMDPATLARIFDPFYSTKRTGRGLGLAAALGIVRGHAAALVVQSTPGQGTVFDCWFPASLQPAAPPVPPLGAPYRGSGRVLVVDDEAGPAQVLGQLLRGLGFEPVLAASGREALALCRSGALALRVAIVDMIMPRMDGADTYVSLRALYPELPIVFCSGYDDDVAADLLKHPNTAFLRKPFASEDLAEALQRVLQPDDVAGT